MDATFKKLNLKNQKEVVVLNAPESFEVNIDSILSEATVLRKADANDAVEFMMIFVTKKTETETIIPVIAPRLAGDAVLWMCYGFPAYR